jgi:hypothetical protein
MSGESFGIFQNEGHLMQGCFKSGLHRLRNAESGQPSDYYSGFFLYSIGLERLLKIIYLLDYRNQNQTFPTNEQLRDLAGKTGHDIEKLHGIISQYFSRYKVASDMGEWALDDLDRKILGFVSSFNNGSRYFNLDQLTGKQLKEEKNPIRRWQEVYYELYKLGHPNEITNVSVGGKLEQEMTDREIWGHGAVMMWARPAMCWRLVRILIPLRDLLIAVREANHAKEARATEDSAIPFMEEFLDFVCADKSLIFEPDEESNWPY